MDLGVLIPPALDLPGPPGLLKALSLTTFGIHLLLVNVVMGGAAVLLARSWLKPPQPDQAVQSGFDEVKALPPLMALLVNLAVPTLLMLQTLYGNFTYVTGVLMGGAWLATVGIVLTAYAGIYSAANTKGFIRRMFLAVVVVFMASAAFMLSNHMTLMLVPERWTAWFSSPGPLLNLSDPTLWPRYLHMLAASVAVGGLVLALVRSKQGRTGEAAWFGKVFVHATLAQMAAGVALLLTLPTDVQLGFLGADAMATHPLWAGVALGVGSVLLAAKGRFRLAAFTLLATVGLMIVARDSLRRLMLEPHLKQAALRPDEGGMLFFAVCAGLGAVMIAYVLWAVSKPREAAS